ncbi:DUF3137 domain-containing protein [Shewanella acanthi]|uniref:DUF3137 domain-containing protein n=1 Tax=Shewanella acanthi TaxID=2864212 RepID=UPI001C660D1A|nr:DUF3137 domain-containing protein [Shewanella acanthi]QYJ78744.1 DUF3137 domain-containing protein [Shewanella acanthi]
MNFLTFILGSPIRAIREGAKLSVESSERAAFQGFYDTELAPLANRFESQRVASLKAARKRLYLCLTIVLGLTLLAVLAHGRDLPLFILPIVAFIGLGVWSYSPVKQFKHAVQREIYPIMFKYFGEDFIYNREMRLDMNRLVAAKVLPSYDKAKFGDYIQGKYKGVELIVNEITLTKDVTSEEWQGNKRRTVKRTETRFRGTVVELSSHKTFNGHTVVLKDRGGLANFFSDSHAGLERVKLEDPLFEKEFDVFSTDQIESRYLLNTAFMDRLQQLAKYFEGNIQCAFFRNRLIIFLPNRRSRFQAQSIFNGASFASEFSQLNREMKQLFAIIEVLKLNEYTGL